MNDRLTEVFKNGQWIEREFEDVEVGERFRLFEKDGMRVRGKSDSKEWVANGKPFLNEGVWTIDADFDIDNETAE